MEYSRRQDASGSWSIKPTVPLNETELRRLATPELVVLSEAKQADLSARFRREADAYYVEAKRSMVSSIEAIPRWVYVIVAVLGWNEFVAVLRSPVYFTMLLLLGGAAYVIFRASFAIVFHD